MTDPPARREAVPPPRLIDAQAAGALLGVPKSWMLAEARCDRIPHVRLGRYVRFDPKALEAGGGPNPGGPWAIVRGSSLNPNKRPRRRWNAPRPWPKE